MIKYRTLLVLVAAGSLTTTVAQAQRDPQKPDKDPSLQEEINVVTTYKPRLTDVDKLDVNVVDEPELGDQPELTYEVETQPIQLPVYQPDAVLPPLRKPPLDRLYEHYLKLGGGNYASVFAEYFYSSNRNEEHLLAAHAKHYSGNGPVEESGFRQHLLELYGKKNWDQTVLAGEAGWHYNRHRFYGTIPDSLKLLDGFDTRQVFNEFFLRADFGNAKADTGEFRYDLNVGYNFFHTRYAAKEHLFQVGGTASEYFGNDRITLNADYEQAIYNYDTTQSRSWFSGSAHYRLTKDDWFARIGFSAATQGGDPGQSFFFYPDIMAEYQLAGRYLIAYGGITGHLDFNTYQSFAKENIWLSPDVELRNTNTLFELFAGAKGSLSNRFSFFSKVSYSSVENMAFYLNDPLFPQQFQVVYDSTNTNVLSLEVQGLYQIAKELSLGGKVAFHSYNTSLPHAWHRPNLEAEINGRYSIQDKIVLTLDLYSYGRRWATIPGVEVEPVKLPTLLDANAEVKYNFSKTFAAYIQFQNILNNQYQWYYQYPVRGFHLLAGLTVDFGL